MATSTLVSSPRTRRTGQRDRLTLTSINPVGAAGEWMAADEPKGKATAPAAVAAAFKKLRRLSHCPFSEERASRGSVTSPSHAATELIRASSRRLLRGACACSLLRAASAEGDVMPLFLS